MSKSNLGPDTLEIPLFRTANFANEFPIGTIRIHREALPFFQEFLRLNIMPHLGCMYLRDTFEPQACFFAYPAVEPKAVTDTSNENEE